MKKVSAYFLMPDDKPNIDSFLRMAHELYMLGFDVDICRIYVKDFKRSNSMIGNAP